MLAWRSREHVSRSRGDKYSKKKVELVKTSQPTVRKEEYPITCRSEVLQIGLEVVKQHIDLSFNCHAYRH